MNRRDWMKASGGMMAAAALGASAQGAMSNTPQRKIKKAVKIGMVQEGKTLKEKFQVLKDLGFDGVEMDSPTGISTQEVLDATASTGLPVHGVVDSVHWRKPFSHPNEKVRVEALKGLETALRDAKAWGGSSVLVVPAVVGKRVSYREAWDRSITEIKKMVPLAEELGLTIAFENVWNHFLLSPLEAASYVDAFESENVGWYFDVGNIVNYGWPEHWVEALGKRIYKLDIKEFSRKRRNDEGLWKGFGVKLLEGDCDWPAVMKALDAVGFEGWATAEISGGKRDRLKEIAERMDKIIAS